MLHVGTTWYFVTESIPDSPSMRCFADVEYRQPYWCEVTRARPAENVTSQDVWSAARTAAYRRPREGSTPQL